MPPLITKAQRFQDVQVNGSGGTNDLGIIKGTLLADLVLVKFWGASSAETPQAMSAVPSWDASNRITITTPGTGSIGSGIYNLHPSGIPLNLTENLGYPCPIWFNPGAVLGTPHQSIAKIPYPNLQLRLQGNAAGTGFTVNIDAWLIFSDGGGHARTYEQLFAAVAAGVMPL